MADAGEKLKVFVSYSRRDASEFADELVAGLELAGFAPFLDRHDIAAGGKLGGRAGGAVGGIRTGGVFGPPPGGKNGNRPWGGGGPRGPLQRLPPGGFHPAAA